MKYLLIILLIPCLSFGQMSSETKHVYAGAAITFGTAQLTYHWTQRIGVSIIVGWIVGNAVGIAKEEIYDKRWGKGTYSKTDMLDTNWGTNLGSIGFCFTLGPKIKRQREKKKYKKINYYQY